MNNKSKIKNKKGFALLYAVLVSSILLSIGLAIFNITMKELLLSSLGRDSQFAFYAADTGIECALYWDFVPAISAFSTSSPAGSVNCGGGDEPDRPVISTGGDGVYERRFQIDFAPEPYCVKVLVTKKESPRETIIESRGYNTCDNTSPRRVERALRVTY